MLVAKALLPPTALSGENVHLLKVHALSHHQEDGSPWVKRAQGTLGAPLVKLEGLDTGHDGNPVPPAVSPESGLVPGHAAHMPAPGAHLAMAFSGSRGARILSSGPDWLLAGFQKDP